MHRARLGFSGLSLLVMCHALSDAAGALTFTDTFIPDASPLWSNSSGDWIAGDGNYYAQLPNNNPLTYTGLPFDLIDFSIDVDVNNVGDGGIWLRTDGTRNNGVLLVTGGKGYGVGRRGGDAGTSLYWHVFQSGSFSSPLGVADFVLVPGNNYHIRVTVSGDVYSAFINGSATPATTLTVGAFAHGRVGLYDAQPITAAGGSGPAQSFSGFQLDGMLFPHVRPDFNGDGKVDGIDLAILLACWTGPEVPYDLEQLPAGCTCGTIEVDGQTLLRADLDTDIDVDQDDFGVLQRCWSGIEYALEGCEAT